MSKFRIWQDIAAVLRAEIASGQWEPDAVLPSQTELAARFGVQSNTIGKALQQLTAEGLLYAPHGLRERRIAGPRPVSDRTTGFLADPAWRDPWIKTLDLSSEEPPATIRRLIPQPDRLVHWRTLQGDGSEVVAMADAWYRPAAEIWDAVMKPNPRFYDRLAAAHGVSVEGFDEIVLARLATAEERRLFHEIGSAPLVVFDIERVTRATDGTILEWVRLIDRATRYRLHYWVPATNRE